MVSLRLQFIPLTNEARSKLTSRPFTAEEESKVRVHSRSRPGQAQWLSVSSSGVLSLGSGSGGEVTD